MESNQGNVAPTETPPTETPPSLITPSETPPKTPPATDPNQGTLPDGFDFRQSIPAEFASEACLQDVPDYNTLIKNYVNAQKLVGSSIRIPGEGATDDEVKAFHAKLGVPDTLDKYKEVLQTQGVTLTDDTAKLVETALSQGITPTQFSKLAGTYGELVTGAQQKQINDANVAMQQLRTDWGAEYDKSLGLAQETVRSFGGEALAQALQVTGAGNNVDVIKAFAAIGASLAGEGLIDGTPMGAITKEGAMQEADKLMASEAYLKQSHPEHKTTMQEVERLFQIAYPESSNDGIVR